MIEVKQLSKSFGSFIAVDNLSFTVEPGEILGFLGPNGAGKSTSMKMITGFLHPTSGTVTVCGHDIKTHADQARKVIGYLPEGAPSYGEMTTVEFLHFVAAVRGIPKNQRKSKVEKVIDDVNLDSVVHQTIDTLSKGYKRRVGLAQAIIHDPQVLILDEPTDGLDPNQKHEVRRLIEAMAKDKIIIVSTHILEEVEAVCTRAMIIARGKILADSTPAELQSRSAWHGALSITIEAADQAAAVIALEGLVDVKSVAVDTTTQLTVFPVPGQQLFAQVTELFKANAWAVHSLQVERGRLDTVFRDITQGAQ